MRIVTLYGTRESIAYVTDSREKAERAREVLQEGADSNPRSSAVYWVEKLD